MTTSSFVKIPDGSYLGNLLLSPLHYCGSKWNSFSEEKELIKKISQIVQKTFLFLATVLAFIPAIPGSIIKGLSETTSYTIFTDIELDQNLREFFNSIINEKNETIVDKIKEKIRGREIFTAVAAGVNLQKHKAINLDCPGPTFLSYIDDCFSQTPPKNPEQIKKSVHMLFQQKKELTKEELGFIQDSLRFSTQIHIEIPTNLCACDSHKKGIFGKIWHAINHVLHSDDGKIEVRVEGNY